MNILICDDHAMFVEGIKKLLEKLPETKCLYEATDGNQALKMLESQKINMLLIDIIMPDWNGIELLKVIKTRWPQVKVLIISMCTEEECAINAYDNGAQGYLNKRAAFDELANAIKTIAKGDRYFTASASELLLTRVKEKKSELLHKLLTAREMQIMLMLAAGKKYAEIARILNISANTIGTHRSRIIAKMKCKNNTELSRYCFKNKLI